MSFGIFNFDKYFKTYNKYKQYKGIIRYHKPVFKIQCDICGEESLLNEKQLDDHIKQYEFHYYNILYNYEKLPDVDYICDRCLGRIISFNMIDSYNTKYNSLYLDPKFRLKIRSSGFDNIMYPMDNKEFKENKGKIDDKFYSLKYEDTDIVYYKTKFGIDTLNMLFFTAVVCDYLIPLITIRYDIVDTFFGIILINILKIMFLCMIIKPFLCFLNMKYINYTNKREIYHINGYKTKFIILVFLLALGGLFIDYYIFSKYIDFTNKISILYEQKIGEKFNIQEYNTLDSRLRKRIYERITHPELHIENNKEEQRKMEINEIYYNFLRSL